MDKSDPTVGTGLVGAPACGDVMKLQMKFGPDGRVEEAVFKVATILTAPLSTACLLPKEKTNARPKRTLSALLFPTSLVTPTHPNPRYVPHV